MRVRNDRDTFPFDRTIALYHVLIKKSIFDSFFCLNLDIKLVVFASICESFSFREGLANRKNKKSPTALILLLAIVHHVLGV